MHKVHFPVPRPLLYCEDPGVIGTAFYVMEHVKVCMYKDAVCVIVY